ncbi:prolyl-tRNA synthetase associated domain-containing protein [Candidatus Enterococcus ferrettii]|uniref:Ala-tRNA(Pro) deacylase n=1 Tax=Candidatus Enterococcus ferrettii TaxID=2815324 RepID=A0ABV0EWU7_9ENTE|nr:YbaK/EbsC family protein [Enterococcus sp. 665A]MBO1339448.1 prolyl-tRNA synthetase associated domain-containing protein [Enterococcus sp. 665A]
MIQVSEIYTDTPTELTTAVQEQAYQAMDELKISFERVATDEVITMEDCLQINERLDMNMVKTLFLCNRQQTNFYLFVTRGDKPFRSKDFSKALEIARVSFASEERMAELLGTQIGAATVFSVLIDPEKKVQIVFDQDVVNDQWYGCSDGTTTGYLKIATKDIVEKLLPYSKHDLTIIEV